MKIHMIKRGILILFLILNCMTGNSQDNKKYIDVESTESRIQELITVITDNLQGTSVYEQFVKEQKIWEEYREAHIQTLFPDFIDEVEMLWGSILGYAIGEEIFRMNIERIIVLESFLNHNHETGTDGKGLFKEYVDELRRTFITNR